MANTFTFYGYFSLLNDMEDDSSYYSIRFNVYTNFDTSYYAWLRLPLADQNFAIDFDCTTRTVQIKKMHLHKVILTFLAQLQFLVML